MQEAFDKNTLDKKRPLIAVRKSSNKKALFDVEDSIEKTKECSRPLRRLAYVDSTDSETDFSDGYDVNLTAGEADQKYLKSLSERDRELELFRRGENRVIQKLHWDIERKIKKRFKGKSPAELPDNSKNTISAVKLNDSHTSSKTFAVPTVNVFPAIPKKFSKQGRPCEEEISSDHSEELASKRHRIKVSEPRRHSAMEELKAHHIRKQQRKKQLQLELEKLEEEEQNELEIEFLDAIRQNKTKDKLKASEVYSDDSDAPDSKRTVPVPPVKCKPPDTKSQPIKKNLSKPVAVPYSREALQEICLTRFRLEQFLSLPFFDQLVKNTFVRINIGSDRNNLPLYRLDEIRAVQKTPRLYQFGTTSTNRTLLLRHGTEEYPLGMEFISNQAVTDVEFDEWCHMKANAGTLPSAEFLKQKTIEIREAKNYEFREEDIDRIVQEKNRFRSKHTNNAMHKTKLLQQRKAAELQGDMVSFAEFSAAISEFDERRDELDKKRTSRISSIAYLNDRNRKQNIEDAEEDLLSEARSNTGVKMEDPFTRRQTKPRMKYIPTVEEKEKSVLYEQIQTTKNPKNNGQDPNKSQTAATNEIDFYAMHDFEIDFNAPLQLN